MTRWRYSIKNLHVLSLIRSLLPLRKSTHLASGSSAGFHRLLVPDLEGMGEHPATPEFIKIFRQLFEKIEVLFEEA